MCHNCSLIAHVALYNVHIYGGSDHYKAILACDAAVSMAAA
jgi:hypothetical protein